MKYHRRLIRILQQQLLQHIEHHSQNEERSKTGCDNNASASLRELLRQRLGDLFEESHFVFEGEWEGRMGGEVVRVVEGFATIRRRLNINFLERELV